MRHTLACFAVLLLCAVPLQAQTKNPTGVTFDHVDYASAQSYEIGYFALLVRADHTCDFTAAPATAPAYTDPLARPATTTGVGMSSTLPSRRIGCYVAKVRALDTSGLYSDWSDASSPFWAPSAAPAKPTVK